MKRETGGNSLRVRRVGLLARAVGLALALCLIAGSLTPIHAQDSPQLPHFFAGTVTVRGKPANEGTLVEAFLDDIKKRETTVDEHGRYALLVEGPGITVTFRVGGVMANETAIWESGKIEELSLTAGKPSSWGICFIATAAFGSPTAREVEVMVQFWHQYILTNRLGQGLAAIYNKLGPPVAEFITEHAYLKPIVRAALLPAVALSILGVNTTATQKAALAGSSVLVLVVLAVLLGRRRGRSSEHNRA